MNPISSFCKSTDIGNALLRLNAKCNREGCTTVVVADLRFSQRGLRKPGILPALRLLTGANFSHEIVH